MSRSCGIIVSLVSLPSISSLFHFRAYWSDVVPITEHPLYDLYIYHHLFIILATRVKRE